MKIVFFTTIDEAVSSFVFILPLNLLRNLARKPNVWVISGVATPNPHNWAPVLPMSAAECHHRCSFLCKIVQHHLQHLRGEGMVQGPMKFLDLLGKLHRLYRKPMVFEDQSLGFA